MKKSTPTPGLWRVERMGTDSYGESLYVIRAEDGSAIATVYPGPHAEANLELILQANRLARTEEQSAKDNTEESAKS